MALHFTPLACLEDSTTLVNLLEQWADAGWIRRLDVALARFCHQQCPDASPLLLLAAALASHQHGHGHVCLDLAHTLCNPDQALALPPDGEVRQPDLLPAQLLAHVTLPDWLTALQHSQLVACGKGNSPLVLDQQGEQPLLYLRRLWHYEHTLRAALTQRLESPPEVDETTLGQCLRALFPATAGQINWQQAACLLAARQRFAVITGGPGTGKTTTVVRLLALLQALALLAGHPPLRIRLAAPTGKAAARLNESIAAQVASLSFETQMPTIALEIEALRAAVPTEVTTLHRLLGPLPDSRFFRHHGANPLPVDLVVVDEASMIDVEMMAQLVDALPTSARLVLLGDKDQLASVEAGAVLGSLCEQAEQGHYWPDTAALIERYSGTHLDPALINPAGRALDQAVTMLRHSYRFGSNSGIGALARAVNQSAVEQLPALLDGRHDDLTHLRLRSGRLQPLARLVCDLESGYGAYLQQVQQQPDACAPASEWDQWAQRVLARHADFQLLAAVRGGELGVEQLNLRIREWLAGEGLIAAEGLWYAGRPIMITRNDYRLGLMNGDIGIALTYPHMGEHNAPQLHLRVAFSRGDGSDGIRWVLPSRLPSHETVFAMTVHKSQGSEFTHTALLLPAHDTPILTRELVYTGITRARKHFTLIDTHSGVLQDAIQRRVYRSSGVMG